MSAKKKTEKARSTTWFVKPLDPRTNEALYELASQFGYSDNTYIITDNKGNKHSVWEVPHEIITRMQNSRADKGLRFRVFSQTGGRAIQEGDIPPRVKTAPRVYRAGTGEEHIVGD